MTGKNSWITAITLLLFSLGCTANDSQVLQARKIYASVTSELIYEVDYMEGAEPFVEKTDDGDPVWLLLRNNVSALLNGRRQVVVPLTLAEMEKIPAEGKDYSTEDLMALASTYRNRPSYEGSVASIYVLFVDGRFISADGNVDASVLGVSLGNTGVVVMFKPPLSAPLPTVTLRHMNLGTFVEQTTLIHESGHALGLVNNGIDEVSQHQDVDHGAHCSNPNCIMYYLNEGGKDLAEFLGRSDPSVQSVFFGSECLEDAQAVPVGP